MKQLCWAALALLLPAAGAPAATSAAVPEQSWNVAGLTAPADIVIDHWGITHIFAADIHDAFFLQGYNAARDRLWQIDLWRKRGQLQAVIDYLEHSDGAQGKDPAAVRDVILLESLKSALAELNQRLGSDMRTWAWGRLHHALFEPAIGLLADPQLRAQMSVGPLETPGSSSTPHAQAYRPADASVIAGASVRLVMDVGAWDNSVAVSSPGQSDDPMSAHYRDLFPLWAEGSCVPLRFSRAAVDLDAADLIHVSPGR